MNGFKKLFFYAHEKRHFMYMSLIFSAIATIISFVPYYFFWELLEEITEEADVFLIQSTSMKILGTTLLYVITYTISMLCSHVYAFRLETNMRKRGLEHLLYASFSFFDTNPSGRVRKIIDDNASNTHTIIAHMLPDSVNAILFPICLLALAFVARLSIGLLVISAIIFALLCFKMMYSDNLMMSDYMAALENINSATVEYVRNIQVIKIFDTVIESFDKLYESIVHYSEVVNRQCRQCKIPFILFQCGMMCFGALIICIVYPQISIVPVSKTVSLVAFFMTFVGLLETAFMKIMFFNQKYALGQDAVKKLETLFDQMEEKRLLTGTICDMPHHDIAFEDVSFGYHDATMILNHVNLEFKAGKTYALVGNSGGGKSTIAKLISGFYPIQSGSIKIGGIDLREYTSETLEKNIAFVFQSSKLFKTTIYENVRVANPNCTHEEVMKALEYAMCNSILDKFEQRENTVIGSKGVYLSGGEVQRIAIARAILKDAPIVILDESSAASDPENEYEMQQAFSKLMKDKTVIMIAHRLSSIKDVDEILFIENGEVIERGSHQTLMEIAGKYHRFYRLFEQANDWRI